MTVTASTLAVDYARICRELGRFLGYDRDPTNWTDEQADDISDIIKTGLLKYLHPPVIPPLGKVSHEWSFLRPIYRFDTAADVRRYTLPADFEQFIGTIQYEGSDQRHDPITIFPAIRLMRLENEDTSTGWPREAAIEPLTSDLSMEQSYQLVLHPTPDAQYHLIGQYQIGMRLLSDTYPYPPGGPEHGEGWLAACLPAAEAKLDDNPNGAKQSEFMERLFANICLDLQRQPKRIGYMGDPASLAGLPRSALRRYVEMQSGYTNVNGVVR